MTGDDEPAQQWTSADPVDLRAALETVAIEYLDVDEQRTIAIYQHAILMVIATEGKATAARECTVELWEESPTEPGRDPDQLLSAFIDELVAAVDTARR